MPRDFYTVLGAPRDADQGALKKAYREKARTHHPDRNANDPEAVARFKEIKRAYDFLSDRSKRAQYDRVLALKESGELGRMLEEERFRRVPFVPFEPFEPLEPEAPPEREPIRRPGVPYPKIPPDAHLHPEIEGWWVPIPPDGRASFMPNPYYHQVVTATREPIGSRGREMLAELLDLVIRRRW